MTNGYAAQNAMNDAAGTFQEIEAISPDGLGPVYNAVSCASCHQNQVSLEAHLKSLFFARVITMAAGRLDSRPGVIRGIPTAAAARLSLQPRLQPTARPFPPPPPHHTHTHTHTPPPPGHAPPHNRSLINQRATCPDAQEHLTDVDNIRATRLSLPIFGDGFVEAVPDATLLAIAKSNGGEAIQVPVLENSGTTEVGRFGAKDQHASLLSFSSDAYLNEMGITNLYNQEEVTQVCNPAGMSEPK